MSNSVDIGRNIISSSSSNPKKTTTRNGRQKLYTVICGNDGKSKIPTFNDVQISTMTVIAHTNLIINTDKFYKYIPVTDYVIVKKKRGRKKKIQPEDPNRHIPVGSVISLTKKRCVRGVVMKPKKKKSKTYFRHSVSVVMVLDQGKMLNVKVSSNGKLQMTGCKTSKHAIEFVKHIYSLMIEAEEWTGETLFTYKSEYGNIEEDEDTENEEEEQEIENPQDMVEEEPPLERRENDGLCAVFRVAMKNIDFDIGYKIRRDLLNTYINLNTEFRSIFESSVGTSVNIKIKASQRFDTELHRLKITSEGECLEDMIPYEEFFDSLSTKEQKDERKKERYHTFLCFASGSIIMSSAGEEMSDIFYKLVRLLIENRDKLEDKPTENLIDSSWLDIEEDIKQS